MWRDYLYERYLYIEIIERQCPGAVWVSPGAASTPRAPRQDWSAPSRPAKKPQRDSDPRSPGEAPTSDVGALALVQRARGGHAHAAACAPLRRARARARARELRASPRQNRPSPGASSTHSPVSPSLLAARDGRGTAHPLPRASARPRFCSAGPSLCPPLPAAPRCLAELVGSGPGPRRTAMVGRPQLSAARGPEPAATVPRGAEEERSEVWGDGLVNWASPCLEDPPLPSPCVRKPALSYRVHVSEWTAGLTEAETSMGRFVFLSAGNGLFGAQYLLFTRLPDRDTEEKA